MRLKSVVKYNLSETKNSVLIFYGIMVAIMVLLTFSIVSISYNSSTVSSVSGVEMASVIFLFIAGLNSFKQNYLFLSTNGITRKAQYYGFLISSIIIVVVMGAIDTAYGSVLSQSINYSSMFSQIYGGWVAEASKPLTILIGFVWSAAMNLFAIVLGYFITTAYYRMTKMLKIIVSIGVPNLFLAILPTLDSVFNNGRVYGWLGEFFTLLAGLNNGNNPLIGLVSLLVGAVILAGLAYLLVRRAPIKE